MPEFDGDYWAAHYSHGAAFGTHLVNPYLAEHVATSPVGTALDAGCGSGTEARWLAARGWVVTAVDISDAAVQEAQRHPIPHGETPVKWRTDDMSTWEPEETFDLIFSAYAHTTISQHELYRRLAGWVRPGGTLLIVAHQHDRHGHHPEAATARPDELGSFLDPDSWRDVVVDERRRTVSTARGIVDLHDLVLAAEKAR